MSALVEFNGCKIWFRRVGNKKTFMREYKDLDILNKYPPNKREGVLNKLYLLAKAKK